MTDKELREIMVESVFPVAEKFFRPITDEERKYFLQGLTDEGGEPIVFTGKDCGTRLLHLIKRPDVWMLRLGLMADAVANGCAEEGKRWLAATAERLDTAAACRGRKYLPLVLVLSKIGPDGRAIEFIDKKSLARGWG